MAWGGERCAVEARQCGKVTTMDNVWTTTERLTLTKEQAAAALNVPVDTLLHQTRIGSVASIAVGKHQRWLLDDLREYVQNQRSDETRARETG